MYQVEIMQNERNILLNIADILLQEGLITEKERNIMKNTINNIVNVTNKIPNSEK